MSQSRDAVVPRLRRAPVLLALGVALLGPVLARGENAGPRFEVKSVKDVAYFEGPGADPVRHKLDLFVPKDQKDFPVVFFIHGGAWHRGSKEFMGVYGALGTFLARNGVGAVVSNYRLSPSVKHPEHIKDVARAFAWTHKNIATYGGRPDRLFVCGHSAGGHLAALLATDPSYLKAEGLSLEAIRGAIPMSGVYDLTGLPDRLATSAFGAGADVLAEASPARQARGGLPPFLMICADKDLPGCDLKPAEAFAKTLRDKGVKAEAREMTGSSHYKIILSASIAGDPVSEAILGFVAAHVK